MQGPAPLIWGARPACPPCAGLGRWFWRLAKIVFYPVKRRRLACWFRRPRRNFLLIPLNMISARAPRSAGGAPALPGLKSAKARRFESPAAPSPALRRQRPRPAHGGQAGPCSPIQDCATVRRSICLTIPSFAWQASGRCRLLRV
jgi:hypothetical protein